MRVVLADKPAAALRHVQAWRTQQCCHRISTRFSVRGAAMVETVMALPIVVMLVMGVWQAALLYEAKATLNYAVLQGARAGAVNNADAGAIRMGVARGLLPLYAPDTSFTGAVRKLADINAELALAGEVRILNPTREAFNDFGVTNKGVKEIPNDRLDIRPTTAGGQSGLNIQDANLLKVRVRFGYELKIPVMRWVFSKALNLTNAALGGADAFETAMLSQNRIPIISTVVVRMQTPARLNNSVVAKADLPKLDRVSLSGNGNSGSSAASSSDSSASSQSSGSSAGSEGSEASSAQSSEDSSESSSQSSQASSASSSDGGSGGGSDTGSEGANDGNPDSCDGGLGPPISDSEAGLDSLSPDSGSADDGAANSESNALPGLAVGNPIHVVTGNKFQRESDMTALPGVLGISFTRYYNSRTANAASALGAGWRHNYDASILVNASGPGRRLLKQADGRVLRFDRAGNSQKFFAQRATDGVLELVTGGYRWTPNGARQLYFDVQGRLQRIALGRQQLVMARDPQGRLLRVTDPQGRQLGFSYTSTGHLQKIQTPVGDIRLDYDKDGNLISATHPDHRLRRYRYEDPRFVHHLTSISAGTDVPLPLGSRSADVRIATWEYDDHGRAISSTHPLYSGKVSLRYGHNYTDVTDAFGRVSRYHTSIRQGVALVEAIDGKGCDACGKSDVRYGYDDNFSLKEVVQRGGVVIRSDHDSLGRLIQVQRQLPGGKFQWQVRYAYAGSSYLPITIEWPSVNPAQSHSMVLEYNESGKLVRMTERGYSPSLVASLPVSSSSSYQPIERTMSWEYDSSDRLMAERLHNGRIDEVRRYSWDEAGRISVIAYPDGTTQRMLAFDKAGRATRISRSGQPELMIDYDPAGRMLRMEKLVAGSASASAEESSRQVSYHYDLAGRLDSITGAHGRIFTVDYDDAGRPVRLADNVSRGQQLLSYAPDNQLLRAVFKQVTANGQLQFMRSFDLRYDAKRRLEQVRNQDGAMIRELVYQGQQAWPHRVIGPMKEVTELSHDELGRLTGLQAPDGGRTQIGYDPQDRTLQVTAPNAANTRFVYDDFGRRVQEQSADRGLMNYQYDAADNLIEQRDARGEVVRYGYEAGHRLVRRERRDGVTELTYQNGQLDAQRGPWGEEHWHRLDGRVTEHTRKITNHALVTSQEYSSHGDIQRTTLPSGTRIQYRYNSQGELVGIDQVGKWRSTRLLGADNGDRKADRLDPTRHLRFGNGLVMHAWINPRTGQPLRRTVLGMHDARYQYDAAGHLTQQVQGGQGGLPLGISNYDYDGLGRLIGVQAQQGATQYRYDTAGNRLSISVPGGDRSNAAAREFQYSYAPNSHRLVQISNDRESPGKDQIYRYDAAGNVLQAGERQYQYDAAGRPIKLYVQGHLRAEYRYNAMGERIQKTVYEKDAPHTTLYLYEGHQLVAEADEQGRVLKEYLYLGHHPVVLLEQGKVHFIHTDHLGTPIAVTDTRRRIEWRAEYDAFGRASIHDDVDGDGIRLVLNLRLPGQYADDESGTYYNYYRDYDPDTGRYLTSDPIGLEGGLNTYAYVNSNPLTHADSLGLYDEMVHYYTTYFLALAAGLPTDIAKRIATATQYVDENYQTEPAHSRVNANYQALPRYHFVLDYRNGNTGDANQDVLTRFYNPDSAQLDRLHDATSHGLLTRLWAKSHPAPGGQCVFNPAAVKRARQQLFGEYLHAYEDTFAHRDAYNMPYAVDANPKNTPNAYVGHAGWSVPDKFSQAPDHTYNKNYASASADTQSKCSIYYSDGSTQVVNNLSATQCSSKQSAPYAYTEYSPATATDHTQCILVYAPPGGSTVVQDLTRAQCDDQASRPNVVRTEFHLGTGDVWQYNELRTLRMDYEVFNKFKTEFASEIADNGNKGVQWSDLAGRSDWDSDNAANNTRIGTNQSVEDWAMEKGVNSENIVLQKFNASSADWRVRLKMLNTFLRKNGLPEIEPWKSVSAAAAQDRIDNIGWIPTGYTPGVLLPKDAP